MLINKYNLIISILLISLFVFLIGKVSATQYCPTTITVMDEDAQAPISGARITLNDQEFITNENGEVTFDTVLYSNNRITASAVNYETESIWVYCRSCGSPISETIFLKRIPTTTIPPPQHCTLDIYVKDQNSNSIDANIYVDGSYKNYDDHITVDVDVSSHEVEATKSDYESDSQTVSCSCSETKRVDLTVRKTHEEVDIRIGSLDLDPDYACFDDDENIKMSISITLDHGSDDTFILAKFYVQDKDGNWRYIDKEEHRLERDETRTFSIEFNADDYISDEGIYDVKVKIESDSFQRTAFSQLNVDDCYSRMSVDVGSIDVDNEYPNKGDIVRVSVPINLDYDHLPQTVYVYGYVDNYLVNSVNMRFDDSSTKTYQFTIDTDKYSNGPHTIKVKADIKGRTDSSTRTFSTSPFGYYEKGKEHCLSIDKVWTDDDLKVGERNKVNVRVVSCGTKYEKNVKMKLEAFSNTFYTGEFDIPYGGSKDVFVTIDVPENAAEKQTFKVTVWNSYTSVTWTKDFVVYDAVPFIEIKPEYIVEDCQTNKIRFDVFNNGKVADTFTLSLNGIGSDWVTGAPQTVTLNPGEKKVVYVDVSIPCGTDSGFYEFTITAKGSPEYSATSAIHVIKTFKWPTISISGLFVGLGAFCWLPWIVIILLILFLLLFFFWYFSLIDSRRRPMFDCRNGHGC